MITLYMLDPADNVAVSFAALSAGTEVSAGGRMISLCSDVPAGHKVAVSDIPAGAAVKKYGASIGLALKEIRSGEHVHAHNLRTGLGERSEYRFDPADTDVSVFDGDLPGLSLYRRADGRCGVRNEIWVIPTVGCVNGIAANAVNEFLKRRSGAGGVDGVYTFAHPYGCSQLGDDHIRTRTLLQNMVLHPNAGGVLVLGLGCENNQVDTFIETMPAGIDRSRIKFLEAQSVDDEIEEACRLLDEIYEVASSDSRSSAGWSDLVIGLECGGSDALSGITANPLIGMVSDHIIASGGSTILTEVPEMFGAEQALFRQCREKGIFDRAVEMVNSYKDYYTAHGQPVYENPSPGNKKGGITTLEEKSLGCIRKSGRAPVADVLKMDQMISRKGLNLLYAPGNDIVATTALGTAGAQMVLFSTGRGTPLGGFIPTLKVASNSDLAERKGGWIDFNAGVLAEDGSAGAGELLKAFLVKVADAANGGQVAAERRGNRDIALFKSGVTL